MTQFEQFLDYVTEIVLNKSHGADQFDGSPVEVDPSPDEVAYLDDLDNYDDLVNNVHEYLLERCELYGMAQIIMMRASQYHSITGTITCFLTRNQITVNFYDRFEKKTEIKMFTVDWE